MNYRNQRPGNPQKNIIKLALLAIVCIALISTIGNTITFALEEKPIDLFEITQELKQISKEYFDLQSEPFKIEIDDEYLKQLEAKIIDLYNLQLENSPKKKWPVELNETQEKKIIDRLASVSAGETTGCSFEEKVAVCNVVLNRFFSSDLSFSNKDFFELSKDNNKGGQMNLANPKEEDILAAIEAWNGVFEVEQDAYFWSAFRGTKKPTMKNYSIKPITISKTYFYHDSLNNTTWFGRILEDDK